MLINITIGKKKKKTTKHPQPSGWAEKKSWLVGGWFLPLVGNIPLIYC